jgi:hypothetical protein
MNSFWLSMFPMVILIPALFLNFIIPGIKLHTELNKQVFLEEEVLKILDTARTQSDTDFASLIQSLNIDGLKISKVEAEDLYQFKKFKVYFQSSGLFKKNEPKTEQFMSFLVDRDR